jgi:hypothetical protein
MGLVAEGSPELMPADRPHERLQDPDESMITLKNEERVLTPISNYDSSGANGFITRNRLSGEHPADSKSTSLHNRLDVSGGCCFTVVGMASPEPCTPGFWRRQHRRTRLGWGCALEISHYCRTRACRETGGANHRFFAVCAGCLCDGRFSLEFAGLHEPEPTVMGVVVLFLAATVMPWLAREKRRLSTATGSAALRADAAESATCAYLAVIALAGVVINAVWHFRWADPIAALSYPAAHHLGGSRSHSRQGLRGLLIF